MDNTVKEMQEAERLLFSEFGAAWVRYWSDLVKRDPALHQQHDDICDAVEDLLEARHVKNSTAFVALVGLMLSAAGVDILPNAKAFYDRRHKIEPDE